jgi:hypothetical protein
MEYFPLRTPRPFLTIIYRLLAAVAFLAVASDVSLARDHNHPFRKSGAGASDIRRAVPSVPSPTSAGPKVGAKTGAGAANPIDLSITVQPVRSSKKTSKPADAKKTINADPAENLHKRNQAAPNTKFGPMRNAVGIPLDRGAGGIPSKDAVGGSTTNGSAARTDLSRRGPGPGAWRTNSGPNGLSVSHQGLNVLNPGGMSPHNGISGKDVFRLGSGPASVGGVAKNMSGINGTALRPRRCPGRC